MSSSNNMKIIGVDLGGTKIVAGLTEGGEILKKEYNLVPNSAKDSQEIIDVILKTIDAVYDKSVKAIGIGVPSLVDREKGIVYEVQNIPSWKKIHLKEILETYYNIPIYLDNDANCFALGESKFGKGKFSDNFVGITIGTGMGAGIINNSELLQDANCGAGEFGSIPYLDGIYEDYCSGKFFKTHYRTNGINLYNKAIKGEKTAKEAFKDFGRHLGNVIKTIMFSVDPKKIIIGGSIAVSQEFFHDVMIQTIKSFPYEESVHKIEIVYTNTLNIAILGAASLCYNKV